jgi:outer membrane immunogenic protein
MRRSLLLAAACAIISVQVASAADMPTKAPAYAPIAIYNWTGFYVGGHGGYGWGSNQSTATSATTSFPVGFVFDRANESGALAGGQLGFSYQIANWVLGVEGDYSWANIKGDETSFSPLIATHTLSNSKLTWLATATGRIGYAWNNWLPYVKGGVAWTHNDGDTTTINNVSGAVTATASGSETRSGWTVGAGVEYGFWNNWSARLEYDYLDFGTTGVSRTFTSGALIGTTATRNNELHVSVVKAALNYRFNWGG